MYIFLFQNSNKPNIELEYGKHQELDQETYQTSTGDSTDRTKSEHPHWVFNCRLSLIAAFAVFTVLFILFGLLQARQYKKIKKFYNATLIKM